MPRSLVQMEEDAASRNSAGTQPIDTNHIGGHAQVRLVSSDPDLVLKTQTEGMRLLRKQPVEGNEFEDRWNFYRLIDKDELSACLARVNQQLEAKGKTPITFTNMNVFNCIHFIATNLRDEPPCTTFFVDGLSVDAMKELVQSYFLDLLDTDDPTVIKFAIGTLERNGLLEVYFKSGDQHQARRQYWHIVSNLHTPHNLLAHCCRYDFSNCLELLLSKYSPESPETKSAPWLILADTQQPVDKKFQDQALHVAAFYGSVNCTRVLLAHARVNHRHRTTIKGKTALDIAGLRCGNPCYNILAPIFGKPPRVESGSWGALPQAVVFLDYIPDGADRAHYDGRMSVDTLVNSITDQGFAVHFTQDVAAANTAADKEEAVVLPEGCMLLRVLDGNTQIWSAVELPSNLRGCLLTRPASDNVKVVAAFRKVRQLDCAEGKASVIVEALEDLKRTVPNGSTFESFHVNNFRMLESRDNAESFKQLFGSLSDCATINFQRSFCHPPTLLQILTAVRVLLESKCTSWQQLWVVPDCSAAADMPPGDFVSELSQLVSELRNSSVHNISRVPIKAVPKTAKVWALLVSSSVDVRRFLKEHAVDSIKNERVVDSIENEQVVDSIDNAFPFFLHGLQYIEQFLFDKNRLLTEVVPSLNNVLDTDIKVYVQQWLENVLVKTEVSEPAKEQLLQHLDFALWALAKMHRLLDFVPDLIRDMVPLAQLGPSNIRLSRYLKTLDRRP